MADGHRGVRNMGKKPRGGSIQTEGKVHVSNGKQTEGAANIVSRQAVISVASEALER